MGLSIHQSAAFVLARGAMGYEEKIPKELLPVLFAKEAKKGQHLSNVFKHWKVAKEWYDDLWKKIKKIKLHPKQCFINELLILDAGCNDQTELPF
jgi:hypothetical protein